MINNIYVGGDFQCDITKRYPTVLCWDWDSEIAWLEPNPAFDDDSEAAKQCWKDCLEWGKVTCHFSDDYNDLLEHIGNEAYENAAIMEDK
jgi:hypothetical protein